MKKLFIPFILTILFLSSCGKDDEVEVNCIEEYLEQNDMAPYHGEEIGCKSHINLYEYKGKQYFLLGNHCADLISSPIDCDGNELCVNAASKECSDFHENADYIGVVGISK